jgi:hypothetical protein
MNPHNIPLVQTPDFLDYALLTSFA